MLFQVRCLVKRKIAGINWAGKGFLSSVYSQMVKDVLNLLEEFAATVVITGKH